MSLKPLVSVIIPTYNRANMVAAAIQSVLDQTYPTRQIIVVDDGSTDNTEEVMKSFPEVKYIRQSNAGQAAARNTGWKHSNGVYISSLDSDDVWRPSFLENCIEVLEKENLDFVFSNWDQEKAEGGVMNFLAHEILLQPYFKKAVDSWVFLEYEQLREVYTKICVSPSSSLVLRSSSIVSGWNEEMNIADDWGMLLDIILSKKTKAAFTTQTLWMKHINCNNIFDGRNHMEVVKLLWVEDFKTILTRYKHLLTKKEYDSIEKIYLKNLVHGAGHSLLRYSNILESLSAMRKAIFTNPLYTYKVFSALFIDAAKRRLKSNPQ
jgi:glycosyltransferase involved in cell wall biosynthesis